MSDLICFTNCLLAQEDGSLARKDLWIDERLGVILNPQHTFYVRRERPDRIIDLQGHIISPGFIDIQLNGAYGFDFSVFDGDDAAYKAGMKLVAEKIVETGVTSLVATIITQEKSMYPKLLDLLRPFSSPTSASILGWHAEGPFLDASKRGAHALPFLLTAPDGFQTFQDIYGPDNLADAADWLDKSDQTGSRIITLAPEIPGVMDAIGMLSKRGIVVSIGHSVAASETATTSVVQGATMITHLFNAMPQLHHRDPSIIGLLGAMPSSPFVRPFYEIIVDGIHCHPNSIGLAYSAFPDGCILITDAMKILDPHLQDGIHEWRDGKRFVKEGDALYLEGTKTLAGSVVSLDKCVRNFMKFTGCTLAQALKCATLNVAKCLKIEDKKGVLKAGADADLVILDQDGNVLSTWIRGKQVWKRD
ncbi:hypothetical protein C8J56DRAFT_927969 [Mycena floridula]|nr:hypothetical protein C8J56DRAFT_927969 [Mycena floridula]